MNKFTILTFACLLACLVNMNEAAKLRKDHDDSDMNRIQERGITEWRFKRIMDNLASSRNNDENIDDDVGMHNFHHQSDEYISHSLLSALIKKLMKE